MKKDEEISLGCELPEPVEVDEGIKNEDKEITLDTSGDFIRYVDYSHW